MYFSVVFWAFVRMTRDRSKHVGGQHIYINHLQHTWVQNIYIYINHLQHTCVQHTHLQHTCVHILVFTILYTEKHNSFNSLHSTASNPLYVYTQQKFMTAGTVEHVSTVVQQNTSSGIPPFVSVKLRIVLRVNNWNINKQHISHASHTLHPDVRRFHCTMKRSRWNLLSIWTWTFVKFRTCDVCKSNTSFGNDFRALGSDGSAVILGNRKE